MNWTDCLLVVQKGDHSLGYYALASGAELARVPVDPYPHEFALSPDRRHAYLCQFGVALAEDEGPGGDAVTVVDVGRAERVATLECGSFRRPHGIALDTAGRVYVLSEQRSRLLCFAPYADTGALPAGTRLRPQLDRDTAGRGSHLVCVRGDGSAAYCSNMLSGSVTVVYPHHARAPEALTVGARPEGSVLSADETLLYVVNRESASISVIDTRTKGVTAVIETPPGPVRVCWDDCGRLLVALYHAGALAVIEPQRPGRQRVIDLPAQPISISFDAGSRAALLSTLEDEVCVVDIDQLTLSRRIPTRSDPDPTAVVRLAWPPARCARHH